MKLLRAVCHNLRPILVTLGINCFFQPIAMFGPSRLAVFHGMLTGTRRKGFLAGRVILDGSPCAAMVFAWPLSGLASVTRGEQKKNKEKRKKKKEKKKKTDAKNISGPWGGVDAPWRS